MDYLRLYGKSAGIKRDIDTLRSRWSEIGMEVSQNFDIGKSAAALWEAVEGVAGIRVKR